MTIFREEIGAWFLVMFTSLVTGKVWEWIGEGRVEVLEQQPPANPRLFHIRLCTSLVISIVYDLWLLQYTVNSVIQQAKPTMMVMFLFEFAILTTCTLRTGSRYILSIIEASIVKKQTKERLEARRREVKEQRIDILRRRESDDPAVAGAAAQEELLVEDDIDEMDIEVPGWENKGQWVLALDLFAGMSCVSSCLTFRLLDTDSAHRFRQAWCILCFLRHSYDVLRSPDPHHAGSLHDGTLVHQAPRRIDQVPQGTTGHEQVPGCYGRRFATRGHLYYLPGRDAPVGPHCRCRGTFTTQEAPMRPYSSPWLSQGLA